MKKPSPPLSEDELDDLQDLLLDRIDEDLDTTGTDEGVCLLDELDGFFTALVSGPVAVLPAVWLPLLWGDYPPRWQTPEEPSYAMGLLRRYQHEIAQSLQQDLDHFEPYFSYYEMDGEAFDIVDDWCEGYLRGVRVLGNRWEDGHPEVSALLVPLRAFSTETEWQGHELPGREADALRDSILLNVRDLYRYWRRSG